MQSRLRIGIAISGLLFICLICLGDRVSAIALDNDVDIALSNTFPIPTSPPCAPTQCTVLGAPRVVTADDLEHITLDVDVRTSSISLSTLVLNVFHPTNLQPVVSSRFSDPPLVPVQLVLDTSTISGGNVHVELSHLKGFSILKEVMERGAPGGIDEVILTVSAVFTGLQLLEPGTAATITLSGAGKWTLLNRVGDFDEFDTSVRGDVPASDLPTRSMELARALIRIETDSRQNAGVDLDVGGPQGDRPVGFTHSFTLPGDARIDSATLRLGVKSARDDDPGFANDFVLLDGGVRRVGARQPCVPVVFLRDLPTDERFSNALSIDLEHVPVVFRSLPPGQSCPSPIVRNLLADLRDGQLDVIVDDDSKVDFSDLEVRLRDPRGTGDR